MEMLAGYGSITTFDLQKPASKRQANRSNGNEHGSGKRRWD